MAVILVTNSAIYAHIFCTIHKGNFFGFVKWIHNVYFLRQLTQ